MRGIFLFRNSSIMKVIHTISFFILAFILPAKKSCAEISILVENRSPKFEIVIDDVRPSSVDEAVTELNYWINLITGVRLPVTLLSEWQANKPYIVVGKNALSIQNGWYEQPFDQEEARVYIEHNRIGLLGNDESPFSDNSWSGTYYAVLEFVQKELGARWIWPGPSGEEYVPRETLTVRHSFWAWKPSITLIRQLRDGYQGNGLLTTFQNTFGIDLHKKGWTQIQKDQAQWLKRQRMNVSTNVRFGHAFVDWAERFGKDHPDWFARPPHDIKGYFNKISLLNISNPAVHDQIIADWEDKRQQNPVRHRYLNVSPNDGRGFDTRPETRAWDAPEIQKLADSEIWTPRDVNYPVLSDRYVKLWNILARRVKAIDDKAHITTYAYFNYRTPPYDKTPLESNIIVGYVGGEGFYPDETFLQDEWKGWADIGAKLTWRPNILHAGHGIPYLFSKNLYDDFSFFQNNNLLGTDFDALVGHWAGQGLSYYVLAELHSRPDVAYDTLAKEYFQAFGPAAQAVQEYHEYFEAVTSKAPHIMREHNLVSRMTWGGWWPAFIRLIPLMMTTDVIAQGDAILKQAEVEVRNSPATVQERVNTIRKGFEHSKLMAEVFRKLDLHHTDITPSFEGKKDILQPLWDYRQNVLADISVATVRLFLHEQRIFKMWNEFLPTHASEIFPTVD